MNVKARSRAHKTAVLALTFAVMAWMWGGSLVTADADPMKGEPAPVIGQDHPKDPGEVKLFKTAKAVDGMVNTWDITLRAEVKDNLKKSDIVLVGDRSGSMTEEDRMKRQRTQRSSLSTLYWPARLTKKLRESRWCPLPGTREPTSN